MITISNLNYEISLAKKIFIHYSDKVLDCMLQMDRYEYEKWYRDSLIINCLTEALLALSIVDNKVFIGNKEVGEEYFRILRNKVREYLYYEPVDIPIVRHQWVDAGGYCEVVGGANTGIYIFMEKEQSNTDNAGWVDTTTAHREKYRITDLISCPVLQPVYDPRWVFSYSYCEQENGFNDGYYVTMEKQQVTIDGINWVDNGQVRQSSRVINYTSCPIPSTAYRWIIVSTVCEKNNSNENTGTLITEEKEQSNYNNQGWIDTITAHRITKTYNVTVCPLPTLLYHAFMSTGDNNGYNYDNEVLIPFSFGIPALLSSPLYTDPNGLDGYLYISVPTNRTYILTDAIGYPLTDWMVSVGPDNRTGYQNNTIYKLTQSFVTEGYSTNFLLTIY